MTSPIIIRNLTTRPLTLDAVETHGLRTSNAGLSVNALTESVGNIASSLTNIMGRKGGGGESPSSSRRPSRDVRRGSQDAETHLHAGMGKKEDLNIRIEPFTIQKTDLPATQFGPRESLRLIFKGDGPHRWQIDVPTPVSASQKLLPLTADATHEYTGVYLRETNFLAIVESTNLHKWMKDLDDSTLLSSLSIPGTHNSPACFAALPSVRCQSVQPDEQLKNGIRFLDVRVQPNGDDEKSDDLSLVHGAFPISFTGAKKFRSLVKEIFSFLHANPSETVILSLKREGTGDATDQQLCKVIRDHYANPRQWYLKPQVPTLGECRGKIVLLRRFKLTNDLKAAHGGTGWGLNAQRWDYNSPNCRHGDVQVQDFCEVLETENIDQKIQICCDHFVRAAAADCAAAPHADEAHHEAHVEAHASNKNKTPPLYLNFLSAANFWKPGCWPDKIAAKLNPAVTRYLVEKHQCGPPAAGDGDGDGGLGIVVADWVGEKGDWDLVRCIVSMNGRLLLKQRRRK